MTRKLKLGGKMKVVPMDNKSVNEKYDALYRAVYEALDNAYEGGYEQFVTREDSRQVAIDLMDRDADVEAVLDDPLFSDRDEMTIKLVEAYVQGWRRKREDQSDPHVVT